MKVPILKLQNFLLTSIQSDLTDQEAVEFQQEVLQKARQSEAAGLVVDITALEVVDSYMARILNDTASMVRLMGAQVVICGMRPLVALTLVEMGRELLGVETALDLDQAMEKLRQMIGEGE